MRLGIKADNILERAALASGAVPTPLVMTFWGMGLARCLLTAVELGVFEALADGGKSSAELAQELSCDGLGMETLLNGLNGFGYLIRKQGRYSNARITKRWLLKSSKNSMRDALLFMADLWDRLDVLEEAVRTGRTKSFHDSGLPPETWARYMRGLAVFARPAGREVVRKVKLTDRPRRLLDVGGGHGLFSAAFCRKYEGLEAVVLDLPEAIEHGRAIIDEEGFADRVKFTPGDMYESDWGEGQDIILIFNVIHNCTPEQAQDLIKKARRSLGPGGTLAIMDSEHRESKGNLSTTAGFGELFFFLLNGTRPYPEQTMREWMEAAGFENLRKSRLLMAPEVIITGQ